MPRPTDYTEEIAELICQRISSDSRGLAHICNENEDMPARSTVYVWLSKYAAFSDKYARAKEAQCHVLADEILDISDSSKEDWVKRLAYKGPVEDWELNGESIHRSRLRVDSRKWLLSKLMPKKYGEAQQIDMTVKGGMDNTLKIEFVEPKKAAE